MEKQEDIQEKGVGQYLREIRLKKGISLREAAEETKIRTRYLKALEEDDLASLPGEVYARGFLRNYARFLGIPADKVSQYKPIVLPEEREVILKQPVIQKRSRRRKPRRWLPTLLLAAGIIVVAFFLLSYFVGPPASDTGDKGPLNGGLADQVPPDEEGNIIGEKENEGEPPAGIALIRDAEQIVEYVVLEAPITMEVRVGDLPCWLRVVADGSVIADETLRPGDVREYTARTNLRGRAGNPGSLSLVVNDHEVGVMGKQGIPRDFSFSLK